MNVRARAKRQAIARARGERSFGRTLTRAWHDHYRPTELARRERLLVIGNPSPAPQRTGRLWGYRERGLDAMPFEPTRRMPYASYPPEFGTGPFRPASEVLRAVLGRMLERCPRCNIYHVAGDDCPTGEQPGER